MTTTLKWLMQEAASRVAQVSPAELTGSLDRGEAALILDIRESEEWSRAHIPGSMNVPRGWLELRADAASPIADPTLSRDPRARIVAYSYQAPGARLASSGDHLDRARLHERGGPERRTEGVGGRGPAYPGRRREE